MKKSQTGATLIIVLLFLLLISIVATIAIRQSTTDLKIATNDQVETLLLNSADSVPLYFEDTINNRGVEYSNLVNSATGPIGYFTSEVGKDNSGDQVIFCFNPRKDQIYSIGRASILTPNGGKKLIGGSGDGFCNSSKANDYTTDRNAVLVQVMVTEPNPATIPFEIFSNQADGEEGGVEAPEEHLIEIHSASLIPAASVVSDSQINGCLKNPSIEINRFKSGKDSDGDGIDDGYSQTLSGCLKSRSVPNKVTVEQVKMSHSGSNSLCIDFGKGKGELSKECQKKYGLDINAMRKSQ